MKAYLHNIVTWWRQWWPAPTTDLTTPQTAAVGTALKDRSLLELVQRPEAQRVFADLQDQLFTRWRETAVRMVTVCAASSGEGASTVALGLALAAARDPQERLLLVDGNFHQPSLAQAWNLPEGPGLSDYLAGTAGLEAVIQPTSAGNLWVMGRGLETRSHTKLLDSHLLSRTLPPLTTSFSLVIIDSPAVSVHPEALLYAHFSHRTLLVVAAGHSRAPVVLHAISRFPIGLREQLEVVLNRRTYPIPRFLYHKLWSF